MFRNEYPRPQFVRSEWMNLNGQWDFDFDDQKIGQKERWFLHHDYTQKIQVPFAFQTELSTIHDDSFHDHMWYHKTFTIPENWKNKRIVLHFGAVDYACIVYVNGCFATSHIGGNASFLIDITDYLIDRENHLTVYVHDPSQDQCIPRGKQFWKEKPESIWYHRTSGIWQTVWLEPLQDAYLQFVKMTPDIDRGELCVEAKLSLSHLLLQIEVYDGKKKICTQQNEVKTDQLKTVLSIYNQDIFRTFVHDNLKMWSPENPHLYQIEFKVYEHDRLCDTVSSYFGMRKIHAEKGIIYLNNRPYYQKLVLDQGYYDKGLLTAPSDEDFIRDIQLAKKMGFNGCRKHQKAEDPRFLYHADRLGFLVWGEMANCANYDDTTIQKMSDEWYQIIQRDYNHPSIITWVPLNESWGVPFIRFDKRQQEHALALYHLIHSLDQSRFVISNDGWEMTQTDICAIHNYTHGQKDEKEKYETFKKSLLNLENILNYLPAGRPIYVQGYQYQNEPVILTEFGGIGYQKDEVQGWGYTCAKNDESFLEDFRRVMQAVRESEILVGFCYTQLADVEQEINGLLTSDRKEKIPAEIIKEILDEIGMEVAKNKTE